jgi:hypothetical protein
MHSLFLKAPSRIHVCGVPLPDVATVECFIDKEEIHRPDKGGRFFFIHFPDNPFTNEQKIIHMSFKFKAFFTMKIACKRVE